MTDIRKNTRGLTLIQQNMDSNVDRILGKLAKDTDGYVKNNFSAQQPSAPGDPPGVDTGTLKNSIRARRRVMGKEWVVEVGATYGVHLEYGTVHMAARPFMLPAFQTIVRRAPASLFAQVVDQ
ncbi:MAG: hypothetical protein OHK0046_48040 [Anaerolineae bacterium]